MLNLKKVLKKFSGLSLTVRIFILAVVLYLFIFVAEEAKLFEYSSLYLFCCVLITILLILLIVLTSKSLIQETKRTINDKKEEFKKLKDSMKEDK